MRVAFIGGTGPAGIGIGARLARSGHEVVIGSRLADRADAAAEQIRALVPGATVFAGTNEEILDGAEVVMLTVRDDAQRQTLLQIGKQLAGKVVVSMANPLRIGNGTATYVQPPEGSLAEEAQRDAPDARIVSAFHELRVDKFSRLDEDLHSDTLVCGDDDRAKKLVMRLARDVGVRPVDAGALLNSRYVEAFVCILITINFRYKATTSLSITGLPEE
ncbi:MAG TPA: NADPH-dependent F420 reductase [Actinomycetota bacterium]